MSSRDVGREIPSIFILATNVVRLSPSNSAAPPGPPTSHPVACNVSRIKARAQSLNVVKDSLIHIREFAFRRCTPDQRRNCLDNPTKAEFARLRRLLSALAILSIDYWFR
jgi:hypothetical protein